MNLKTLEHLRHCQHVLDNFCDILKKSIYQRPPTKLNTKILLFVSLLPDVKKTSDFFIELKNYNYSSAYFIQNMAICTGVSNLHFQKLILEVFEQKKLKKITNSSKGNHELSLLLYNKFFVLFATKMFVIQSHFTTTNY